MIFRIIGIAAVLIGLLWIGQGTGMLIWPAYSFMLTQGQWVLWGLLLAALGLVLVFRTGRRRP